MRKMKGLEIVFIATVLMAGLFVVCKTQADPGSENRTAPKLLEPREAQSLIEKNKGNSGFAILDVRTPEEYQEGHIGGAINVDYNSGGFKTGLSELDKTKTYLVYCRTGRRSGEAVRVMETMGFTHIVRMKGDMVNWQSQKLPVVK